MAPPPPFALGYASATHAHASGDYAGAAATLVELEAHRPRVSGVLTTSRGTVGFTDLVDVDALIGATFPIYHQGLVYDLAFAELRSLTFRPISDPFDAMWPWVEFETTFGARGAAPFPAFYPGTTVSSESTVRTLRETVLDHALGYAVALGQRAFWVCGEGGQRQLTALHKLKQIVFAPVGFTPLPA